MRVASTIQAMLAAKAFAHTPAVPLSSTLLLASRCLASVEQGHSLSEALSKVPSTQRPAVQAVTLYAMRHWGKARAWRAMVLKKPTGQPWVDSLIALALLLLDVATTPEAATTDAPLYTPHTLVTQAVDATRQGRAKPVLPGLLNAVLRRFQREHVQFVEAIKDDPVAQWGYPMWWQKKLQTTYPRDWQAILSVSRQPPRLVLRVNRRLNDVATVQQAFADQGITAVALGESAIAVTQAGAVDQLPGYAEGWWSVQDLGAQQAAGLLLPVGGQSMSRVLDACAAPGGKTAHLLESTDINLNLNLTALDQDPDRLARVADNLSRLRLMHDGVTLKAADARALDDWWDGQPFDAILADLPCTGSGVVRRHPDIAWLKRPGDLVKTAQLQKQILDTLWQTLAPGGRLLMVTCSVFSEEGEQQAEQFLTRHPDAMRLPAPGQLLPRASTADDPGQDGFFYGLFEREGTVSATANQAKNGTKSQTKNQTKTRNKSQTTESQYDE